MAFPERWDRFDRFTLRFVDRELERAYQHADQAEGVRRARTASLVAAVVWVVVAIMARLRLAWHPRPLGRSAER